MSLSVLLSVSWQVVDQNPRIGLLIASPVEILAQGRLVKVEYSTGTIKHQPPNHQIPPINTMKELVLRGENMYTEDGRSLNVYSKHPLVCKHRCSYNYNCNL